MACRKRNSSGRKGVGCITTQAQPKTNAEKYEMSGIFGEWEEVKCGYSIWPMEENGRRCCWKSSWGQNVKDHQCSAKGLGIYPAGNGIQQRFLVASEMRTFVF